MTKKPIWFVESTDAREHPAIAGDEPAGAATAIWAAHAIVTGRPDTTCGGAEAPLSHGPHAYGRNAGSASPADGPTSFTGAERSATAALPAETAVTRL